jgi:hypothetical protein
MMRFHHLAPVALAASLALGLSAGCEADNDEPLAYESQPIRGDARNDVPAGATLMKEGHEPLLFQAPSDGTVWVYNDSDERLVYTGALRAGQNVQVDPDHDFVTVDGRKVVDTKMDDFDRHQILFGPSSLTAAPAHPAQPAGVTIPPTVTVQPNPVTIQPQPTEVRVKPAPAQPTEIEVQPSGVKVVPAD